jgi:5-methylcytosine-specific restriction endonuclease McrA
MARPKNKITICPLCSSDTSFIVKGTCRACYQRRYAKSPERKEKIISRQMAHLKMIKHLRSNNIEPKCFDCGLLGSFLIRDNREKRVIGIQVAHIDQNALNNEISNLRLLCRECHIKFDKGKVIHGKSSVSIY